MRQEFFPRGIFQTGSIFLHILGKKPKSKNLDSSRFGLDGYSETKKKFDFNS